MRLLCHDKQARRSLCIGRCCRIRVVKPMVMSAPLHLTRAMDAARSYQLLHISQVINGHAAGSRSHRDSRMA